MIPGIFAGGVLSTPVSVQLSPPRSVAQNIDLSNRRATSTLGTLIGGAKTVYGRKSGKLYFEAVVDAKVTGPFNQAMLGVLRTDASYLIAGKYGYGCGVFIGGNSGRVWSDGTSQVDLGVPTNGTRYEFAFDLDTKLFWVRKSTGDWNGNSSANPATGIGGFGMGDLASYDLTPGLTSEVIGQQVTFNFEASDFAGSPPAGFSAWPVDSTGDNEGLGMTTFGSLRRQNMALSGGDLTATRIGFPAIARSPDYRSEGKFYWEVAANTLNGGSDSAGIANFDATATGVNAAGTLAAVVYRSGNVWTQGSSKGGIGSIANGDRIDIAVDMDARLIWFRRNGGIWNGSSAADPASGTGGFAFDEDVVSPAVTLGNSGSDGSSWTANFGASPFSGAVPVGFTAGWARRRAAMVQYLWTGVVI